MSESENKDAQPARPNLTHETVYHAVYIPQDDNQNSLNGNTKECIHIYQEMPDALRVIKEFKKARLKTFKNRTDAEEYVKTGYEQMQSASGNNMTAIPAIAVTEVKSNYFKAPKPQELVGFRKLIESGNLESVKNTVWMNPRYLISNGDTPAILHVGYRYNALHVAVKADKPDMCALILNTVGNPQFMQLHYGEDGCKSYLDPAQIMLDLYLNMPDKGLNETPLHFAVKFGLKDVVKVLVSYSQCIKTLPNKYKQLPIDIICSRKCQEDEDLKRQIRMLLEDHFYVPVLRSEGNILQPMIGEPFSPTNPLSLNSDPISPRVEVRAFAGPMTKSQALEFRKKWKTPPRLTPGSAKRGQGDASSITNSPIAHIALRLKDTEKGLERVGRDLAEEYQVPWKEYWPFLKDFVDFRCDDGLAKLEKYLEYKHTMHKNAQLHYSAVKKLVNNITATASANNTKETIDLNAINEMQELCDKLSWCSISKDEKEEEDSEEFFTPPSSPGHVHSDSDEDMESAEEGFVIFIEGMSPTRLDCAVYNALSSAINLHTYPYVYRWRHDIRLAMKRDPRRFDDTRSLKRKLFTNI